MDGNIHEFGKETIVVVYMVLSEAYADAQLNMR